MLFWSEEEIKRFHSEDYRCKERLQESDIVGCYYCGSIFHYQLVANPLRSEDTVLCPICGIDAVIPLADVPKKEYASLFRQMYDKYYAVPTIKLTDLAKRHLYLAQKPGRFQDDVLDEVEEILEKSKRIHQKVYPEYDYAVRYTFPIYDHEIIMYPLERPFIDWLIPQLYHPHEFTDETIEILQQIVRQGPRATSFIIQLPGILKEREAEHVVKLIGMAFGGYFARVDQLPANGLLTKQKHIHINQYPYGDYDILNNLERLLEENK